MQKNIDNYNKDIFEKMKHIDKYSNEYWYARELMVVLEYIKWQKFKMVIEKAKITCKTSNYNIEDHFTQVGKMVNIGSNSKRKIVDYKLSRYACYLIAQNGDSNKKVIALAQTYFAYQTRKQELLEEEFYNLSEDEKRIRKRKQIRNGNYDLNRTALRAGVRNFDKFHNYGYKGLYNGETADDIAKRKNLRYREDILDNMCSDELIVNLFRISQTNQKIKNNNIQGENNVNKAHYKMGKDIRNFIKKQGGTMPEDYNTPNKSIKELEKEKRKIENKKAS